MPTKSFCCQISLFADNLLKTYKHCSDVIRWHDSNSILTYQFNSNWMIRQSITSTTESIKIQSALRLLVIVFIIRCLLCFERTQLFKRKYEVRWKLHYLLVIWKIKSRALYISLFFLLKLFKSKLTHFIDFLFHSTEGSYTIADGWIYLSYCFVFFF